jgi:hypothetical protein
MKGGPSGFADYFVTYPGETTETLLAHVGPKDLQAYATDDVLYDSRLLQRRGCTGVFARA